MTALAWGIVVIVGLLLWGAWWKLRGAGTPPDIQRHVDTVNAAIARFDAADELADKRARLVELEGAVTAMLAAAPGNAAALQVQSMIVDMQARIGQAEAEAEARPTTAAPATDETCVAVVGRESASRQDDAPPSMDLMRAGLQKVAYGMVGPGVSADDKARFKQDMTEFASADPVVKDIAARAQALVERSPGLLQSKIYGEFPDHDREQVRYALYFAHELGWIHRKKKGNSYQLFPAGGVIDV